MARLINLFRKNNKPQMSSYSSNNNNNDDDDKSKRSMRDYHLLVTAGPSRDISTHTPVPVNSESPLHIETPFVSLDVYVRIRNYRGPPSSSSPQLHEYGISSSGSDNNKEEELDKTKQTSSKYFEHPKHTKDQYSICFSPVVFKGGEGVNGDDLVLGNDFDRSISQALPPGFGVAWRVARYLIDPGLEGDPWAEKPWLEGPVLSSVNALSYKPSTTTTTATNPNSTIVEESLGSDYASHNPSSSSSSSSSLEIPKTSSERMKFFLTQQNRQSFTFKPNQEYHMDFYNPYLDFNEFALKIPGVTIRILKYWDGQPLRYVLKNRKDGKVYAVVQFMLVRKGDKSDGEEGSEEEEEEEEEEDEIDEETMKIHGEVEDGKDGGKGKKGGVQDTSPDDLD